MGTQKRERDNQNRLLRLKFRLFAIKMAMGWRKKAYTAYTIFMGQWRATKKKPKFPEPTHIFPSLLLLIIIIQRQGRITTKIRHNSKVSYHSFLSVFNRDFGVERAHTHTHIRSHNALQKNAHSHYIRAIRPESL